MIRNIVGSVLALLGATAAVWSPFRAWYDGRHGRDYAIDELFTGVTDAKAEIIGSLFLPFAFAALLTLIGIVLRSRVLVAVAGVVVLGFTILWMVRVGQVEDGLSVGSDGRGLGDGVATALGGGVLLLLAALVMSGRGRRHATRLDESRGETTAAAGQGQTYGYEGRGHDGRGHDGQTYGYEAQGHGRGYEEPGYEEPGHHGRGHDGQTYGYGAQGHGRGYEEPGGRGDGGPESAPPPTSPPPSSDRPWDPGRDETPPPPERRA
ncbi:hypothetical protein [Streptomyces roseoviridis]|uniref:Uncharacterized protein n=1 Tax=Streptomyces roseoviridis TaxID=67361 RepID=A0ABV5QV33_9ACTN